MKRSPEKEKKISASLSFLPLRQALVFAVLIWFGWCGVAGATESQVYYWTDDNGVRHFSNQPPETPAGDVERMQEIPHDAEADQARMNEDKAWMQQERERVEQERRREAAEKAAKEAEEAEKKQIAEEQRQAEEEARREEQAALEEAREGRRSTADKTIFVNPGNKIPGVAPPPPRPTPLPSGGEG